MDMWVNDVSEKMDAGERRKYFRYQKELPLALYDRDRDLIDEEPQLRNISLHGLAFVTIQQMETGEEFRFRLGLSGQGILSGTARIRWIDANTHGAQLHCGAEIRSMKWRDRYKLRRFLDPSSSNISGLFDGLLVVSCLFVAYLLARDTPMFHAQTLNFFLDNATDWLPAGIIAGALAAVMMFSFKR